MKPFRFPLQSLRVLREQREHAAQQRYAGALRARNAAATRLDLGNHELAAAWTALCEDVAEGAAMARLHQTRAWCSELERRCEQLTAAFKAAERLALDAWREMVLASRDRQALEKLHAKHRRAFDREVQRDEQKQLDEIGLRLSFTTPAWGEAITLETEPA